MPHSSEAGKRWIFDRLGCVAPARRVLDIGAGAGGYPDRFRGRLPGAQWIGVEVWAPYVRAYDLEAKYDLVVIGDARWLDLPRLGKFDIAFLGDVLEHMPEPDAKFVVEQVLKQTKLVFLSIPVGHAPQEEIENNPFEEHVVEDYTEARLLKLFPNVIDSAVDSDGVWDIAVFALSTDAIVAAKLRKLKAEMGKRAG